MPARPEGTRSGWDTAGNIELGLEEEDTEVALEGIGRRRWSIGLGALLAAERVVRPGGGGAAAALVGSYNRPAGCCCTRVRAAGYRSALLLLPWASRPLRFSSV